MEHKLLTSTALVTTVPVLRGSPSKLRGKAVKLANHGDYLLALRIFSRILLQTRFACGSAEAKIALLDDVWDAIEKHHTDNIGKCIVTRGQMLRAAKERESRNKKCSGLWNTVIEDTTAEELELFSISNQVGQCKTVVNQVRRGERLLDRRALEEMCGVFE